jgi:N-methylhydantoinase A
MGEPILVGVDVGGTFTDFVLWRNGAMTVHKVPTTPEDQSIAIVQGLRELDLLGGAGAPDEALAIVHGMTVATNALLERSGARTALLTTEGFADALAIGRQNRPHLYRLHQERPSSLVQDHHRLEITERLDQHGARLAPLDEAAIPALAAYLRSEAIESLAIVFLFSFRNPDHERRAAALIADLLPDLPISLSSAILPEYREFERTATTVINAYVQPLVARYLARLVRSLIPDTITTETSSRPPAIHIMQSNGGVIGVDQATQQAARVVLSGPAGGAVGAFAVAEQALRSRPPHLHPGLSEHPSEGSSPETAVNVITFDMGGTSTDVALCPGAIPTTAESTITDLPLRLPVIDIHTVGAGGGSIAFVDAGGALQVGPRSAGAVPGPACYGRGGEQPTVTDANLVLGRIDKAGFLGGQGDVQLDEAAARHVLQRLGTRLHLSAEEAALGVIRIANATMERALRRVSVERGHDPRSFILLPFGGAGPLHACDLADSLGITQILCPPSPGVLSAFGMLMADVTSETSQALLADAASLVHDPASLVRTLTELEQKVIAVLKREAVTRVELMAAIDMRYKGQSYELTTPLALPVTRSALSAAVEAFHAAHEQRYGYAMPQEMVEVVTVRLRASSPGAKPSPQMEPLGQSADATSAIAHTRPVWFHTDGPTVSPCYRRTDLQPGHSFAGPAIVLQYDTTILLSPHWSASVDTLRNLWIHQNRKEG